jgi:formylglycine-generating enzyme required for sulfatase activity
LERQEKARIEREAREAKEKAELEARLVPNISAISPSIIANMVKCPVGSFTMGSPRNELGRKLDDRKVHNVIISKPFYIGKYEVTQKEYVAVMGKNPSRHRNENNPVECISWFDAMEFCKKLNKYGKNIPNGYKFDLPTEAQWEYACRAGTTTSLNSGKNITSETGVCYNLDEVGWYSENSGNEPHNVGLKKPNAWGIYDMHGNVMEWCSDCSRPKGSCRVVRGGGFFNFPKECRSAKHSIIEPDVRDFFLGFRIVLSPLSSK